MSVEQEVQVGSGTTAEDAKAAVQELSFYPIMFQAAYALKKLGILEYLRSKRREKKQGILASEISEKLNIPIYGVKVLLDTAISIDLVTASENFEYSITAKGVMLLLDKQTEVNMNFVQDVCYQGMFDLTRSIQEHKPVGLKHFGDWPNIYVGLKDLPENVRKSWFDFDHFYSDNAFRYALPIIFQNDPKVIVDVGGNTGKWSIECCQYNEDVKMIIADLPGQLEDAKKNVASKGFTERVEMFETNVLKEDFAFPENADAIWMSQFLDCFSEKEITHILSNARKHMKANTKLYIMETYWDRQEHPSSTYCLQGTSLYFTALANGNSKMYHSKEMIECVRNAGLQIVEDKDGIGDFHTMFVCQLI